MSSEPQLYRLNPETREPEQVKEVDFAHLGIKEREHIQEWIDKNPGILGEELLIISKEYGGFDGTNERLDLLAVDRDGTLVIIELKRDDSGTDVHWQAIKYASYCRHAEADQIVTLMAQHKNITPEEAKNRLLQHLNSDDFGTLNNDQRVILVSHRFAPEVTSAVLWLNEKALRENLITCIKLTPFRDTRDDSLYVQASTIIPIPGTEDFLIGIAEDSREARRGINSTLGAKLSATFQRHSTDKVTRFFGEVRKMVLQGLPDEIRPNRTSRWAGGGPDPSGEYWRYYHFWYAHKPWGNWDVSYRINLFLKDELVQRAYVSFEHNLNGLREKLTGVNLGPSQKTEPNGVGITVKIERGVINDHTQDDDEFANRIAIMTREFIEQITPIVDELENESDEADSQDALNRSV